MKYVNRLLKKCQEMICCIMGCRDIANTKAYYIFLENKLFEPRNGGTREPSQAYNHHVF